MLVSINSHGVNFSHSVYLVLDRMIATQFNLLTNISQGMYVVLTYDIEIGGSIQLGKIFPATTQIVYVNGTGMSGDECTLLCLAKYWW